MGSGISSVADECIFLLSHRWLCVSVIMLVNVVSTCSVYSCFLGKVKVYMLNGCVFVSMCVLLEV